MRLFDQRTYQLYDATVTKILGLDKYQKKKLLIQGGSKIV